MRRLVIALAAVFTFGCGSNPTAAPAPVAPAAVRPYVVDTVATGLRNPWSLAFLPDGAMLVTEKYGTLRLFTPKADRGEPVEGGPVAWQFEDGGLLDVVIDPDFAHSRLLYLSFSEGDSAANHTAVFRARLEGRRLVDGRVIFRASPDKRGAGHPGGRLLFLPDQTLLLTIGDGYDFRDQAQRLNSDLGKVVRLDRDGRPAPGNPFADSAGARPEIYSFGHRNPQGLLIDPRDGTIWEHEHGPKGGDEINHLRPGRNYGWPRTTFGVDYSGELVSTKQTAKGIEPPITVWVPSVAPSGFALYLGHAFPAWSGDFFVGALKERSLHRVRIRDGEVVLQETLLRELKARIRDVRGGPDGLLYLLTDDADGALLRLRPAPTGTLAGRSTAGTS
jgi:aldose sugar dehydrogenase